MAGSVSGRVTIVVTPPAAAAAPAVRKLSLWRSPRLSDLDAEIDDAGSARHTAAIDAGAGAVEDLDDATVLDR